jgi:hypothetical protein
MTVKKFNSLSLRQRGMFIEKKLSATGQKCGTANTLVFKDFIITFWLAVYTKECSMATAEPIPAEYLEAASVLLEGECINLIHDDDPAVQERIRQAMSRDKTKLN